MHELTKRFARPPIIIEMNEANKNSNSVTKIAMHMSVRVRKYFWLLYTFSISVC